MKLTMTQKILAKKLGMSYEDAVASLSAGTLTLVEVDTALSNDVTAPVAIDVFNKSGGKLYDADKVTFVLDHFTPNRDIKSAEQCKCVRAFARKEGVKISLTWAAWASNTRFCRKKVLPSLGR